MSETIDAQPSGSNLLPSSLTAPTDITQNYINQNLILKPHRVADNQSLNVKSCYRLEDQRNGQDDVPVILFRGSREKENLATCLGASHNNNGTSNGCCYLLFVRRDEEVRRREL